MTHPEAFASAADAWSTPTSFAGPLEVVGNIRFDESDTDELRNAMRPSNRFGTPAGADQPHLLRSAYYSPRDGENLVATLDGWINRRGEPKLSSRSLPRKRVTLGPAQVSRLVFLTPRISNSLGVRNKELSDVGKSSIDTIWLGNPHVVIFAGGVMQIQTVYDVSSGRGVATRFGVTVYLNGRAGIGDTVTAALRQALNRSPAVDLRRFPDRSVVNRPVPLRFRVSNGLTERVWVMSRAGTVLSKRLRVRNGAALVRWVPRKPGRFEVRVSARGIDGSLTTDTSKLTVGSAPPRGGPTVELGGLPRRPTVGRPVRIEFKVSDATAETVHLDSAHTGGLTWHRQVRTGRAAVNWVPQRAGPARLRIIVRGTDGQTVEQLAHLSVRKRGP
jgi:hypothetical protein